MTKATDSRGEKCSSYPGICPYWQISCFKSSLIRDRVTNLVQIVDSAKPSWIFLVCKCQLYIDENKLADMMATNKTPQREEKSISLTTRC